MKNEIVWDWEQAEVMLDERELFFLWAVATKFCTRLADFRHHFAAKFEMAATAEKLERLGFFRFDAAEIVLTAIGLEAVAFLGKTDISEFARLARETAAVAERFENAPETAASEISENEFAGLEYSTVEQPFIEQLKTLGWQFLAGSKFAAGATERADFREVLLVDRLRAALRKINGDWMDEARTDEAADYLRNPAGFGLLEINERATEMLRSGTRVRGLPNDAADTRPVKFIDFENPLDNDFLVVNQFRVNTPGSSRYIVADLVLFVNGIPLVVVECKSPALTDPIPAGIRQLRRYSNQRNSERGAVNLGENLIEGAENLFYYNQILVSTCFYECRAGSLTATDEYFQEWKETFPLDANEIAARLGAAHLASQQTLAAGLLAPAHLLDVLQNFIVFQETGGRRVKIIPRYPQFVAVRKAIDRLTTGETRHESRDADKRGGIVWHTQGSGKSLTMVFLVRKMRRTRQPRNLSNFKIVIVADCADLQEQLSRTAVLTGEIPITPPNIAALKTELARNSPDIVFAMIQKLRPDRDAPPDDEENADERADEQTAAAFGEDPNALNASENILLIVDEAHRSHRSRLHAALMRALPNAAKIGFTGTPILIGAQKKTIEIFGSFIDRYTIRQSEQDGATVPIIYEGRRVEGKLTADADVDFYFETEFAHLTAPERERVKRDYVNQPNVADAARLIAAKADDILRHYVAAVLPDGFKAQIVAERRQSAVRYQTALERAKADLIEEIKRFDAPATGGETTGENLRFLADARKYLPQIEKLEFAAVISGANDDPPHYQQWSDPARQRLLIERFKRPLTHEQQPDRADNLAFLCVSQMLINGFDAPVEAALYLDKKLRQHTLLQAIARVNRTFPNKNVGLVIDYRGIARQLKEALLIYSAEDVQGAFVSLADELPLLADRHARACAVFTERFLNIRADADLQRCVDLLAGKEIRADFVVKLKKFLQTLNTILPRPAALEFVRDAERLGLINRRAARLYRDEQINLTSVGGKVRRLIDEYVEAAGIYTTVPPVAVTDPEFEAAVEARETDRSKASEMEHAIRHHAAARYQEDPIFYQKISDRLREILQQFAADWQAQIAALLELARETRRGREPNEFGLNDRREARFYDIIIEEAGRERQLAETERRRLADAAIEIVGLIRRRLRRVDFWRSNQNREELSRQIADRLNAAHGVRLERQQAVADRLVELAYNLNEDLK